MVIDRPKIEPKPPILGKRMKLIERLDEQLDVIGTIIKALEKGELDTHILALSPPKAPKVSYKPRRLTKPTHITKACTHCGPCAF